VLDLNRRQILPPTGYNSEGKRKTHKQPENERIAPHSQQFTQLSVGFSFPGISMLQTTQRQSVGRIMAAIWSVMRSAMRNRRVKVGPRQILVRI
jgi:hypothetical protein